MDVQSSRLTVLPTLYLTYAPYK